MVGTKVWLLCNAVIVPKPKLISSLKIWPSFIFWSPATSAIVGVVLPGQ